jgi:hypothetical protein
MFEDVCAIWLGDCQEEVVDGDWIGVLSNLTGAPEPDIELGPATDAMSMLPEFEYAGVTTGAPGGPD